MPSNAPACGSPQDWLSRAESDLALASIKPIRRIRLEDLCYHAQQSVEKALKAVLLSLGVVFPRTHNIKILVERLPDTLFCEPTLDRAAVLTDYSVTARYPGEIEPVTRDELKEALHIAAKVLEWEKTVIG
ncbi:HEPN domain-containing protein [Pontiella sp.]|uniref:HEPN domain-containing protein n=1 Tax=Pontiella sp. TaxID=2837462 RepID=UPI0035651526